jgi:hypothetical protein
MLWHLRAPAPYVSPGVREEWQSKCVRLKGSSMIPVASPAYLKTHVCVLTPVTHVFGRSAVTAEVLNIGHG